MGGRALIFPPISSSMASFAFSLPLAVNESGRKKECFLAQGSFCCLGDCGSAISEKLRPNTSSPWLPRRSSWGSDLILCCASSRENNAPQSQFTLKKKICFLAIIQILNIHEKSCHAHVPVHPPLFKWRLFFYVCPSTLMCLFCMLWLFPRFPATQSLLISAAVCNFGGQPSDLHREVAHLLCVWRDGYSVFV